MKILLMDDNSPDANYRYVLYFRLNKIGLGGSVDFMPLYAEIKKDWLFEVSFLFLHFWIYKYSRK